MPNQYSRFVKVINDMMIKYHGFPKLIISCKDSIFISKLWTLLYYFLSIKQKLFTTIQPHTNSQIGKENSIMKIINWEQNDLAKLLFMTGFVYNNGKNINTSYKYFQLNCDYHSYIFFQKKIHLCSKSYFANKFAKKLKDLMLIYQQIIFYTQKTFKITS